jgi:hypothetical protein
MDQEWRVISMELWSRAARYSHIVSRPGSNAVCKPQSGFFHFSNLKDLETLGPQVGMWWWIYLPLLERLLRGNKGESDAYLVGLGHHIRCAQGHVEREWVHFLPEEFADPDQIRALTHLRWMVSYNATLTDHAQKCPLLLSTEFLERLNEVNHARQYDIPALHPLLLDFADGAPAAKHVRSDFGAHGLPLITADFSMLRKVILARDPSYDLITLLKEFVDNAPVAHAERGGAQAGVISGPPVRCLARDELPSAFVNRYRDALRIRRGVLKSEYDLRDRIESACDPACMESWLKRLSDGYHGGLSGLVDAVLTFQLWLHDLTLNRAVDWAQVVSALSWLPSLDNRRRWSSIVIYLRPGLKPEAAWADGTPVDQPNAPFLIIPEAITAFAAASGFTADEAARDASKQQVDNHSEVLEFVTKLPASAKPMLVRRGDDWGQSRWGAMYHGKGFSLPERKGWPYIGYLIKRAMNADDGLTAWQMCLDLEAQGVPRPPPDERIAKGLQAKSKSTRGDPGTEGYAGESTHVDDPKDPWLSSMVSLFTACASRFEAGRVIGLSQVEQWLFAKPEGDGEEDPRKMAIQMLVTVVYSLVQIDRGAGKDAPGRQSIVKECEDLWDQIKGKVSCYRDSCDWNVGNLFDALFEFQETSETESIRPAMTAVATHICKYVQKSQTRGSRKKKGAKTDEASRCAAAIVRNIDQCIDWLIAQGKKKSATKGRHKGAPGQEGLHPNKPATGKAAADLGKHLKKCLKRPRKGTCYYAGELVLQE